MDIDVNDSKETIAPEENAICVILYSNLAPYDVFICKVHDELQGRKQIGWKLLILSKWELLVENSIQGFIHTNQEGLRQWYNSLKQSLKLQDLLSKTLRLEKIIPNTIPTQEANVDDLSLNTPLNELIVRIEESPSHISTIFHL